jgi:hypothetical protein
MKNSHNDDTNPELDPPIQLTSTNAEDEQPMSTNLEPYVDADKVAAFISEPRKNVIRLAREHKLTCYPMSGHLRHTYKFKLSDVSRDIAKLRRSSSTLPNENPQTKGSNRE